MTTPPLPPTEGPTDHRPSRTKLWIGGVAAAALTLGIAVPVMADSGDEPRLAEPATGTVVMDADEMTELDGAFDVELADDGEFDFEELTPEDIDEINAETDAIVAYLADNGVTVDIETDDDGVRWPAIDDEDDATWELVDQWFVDTYGDEFEILEGCDFDNDDVDFEDEGEDFENDDLDDEDEGEA